jgi:hypothetical protein
VIEAYKQAVGTLSDESADAERYLGFRELRVRAAAGSVLSEKLGDAVADVERLREEFESRRATLVFLRSLGLRDHEVRIARALAPVEAALNAPAVGPWCAAYEALMRDAAAELPDV